MTVFMVLSMRAWSATSLLSSWKPVLNTYQCWLMYNACCMYAAYWWYMRPLKSFTLLRFLRAMSVEVKRFCSLKYKNPNSMLTLCALRLMCWIWCVGDWCVETDVLKTACMLRWRLLVENIANSWMLSAWSCQREGPWKLRRQLIVEDCYYLLRLAVAPLLYWNPNLLFYYVKRETFSVL